ncbi:serine/arginine-rich splicing factor SR45-like [Gallus gallus]|uniref:serine/arginine-rich splicing factor SR45-like n=1 Tax=Gallus gallus TaxID=9031 RepID=UPI001F02A6DD|nr:serine/arginine-rich splicing factor SR45-like [Gallus gallus]
MQVEAKRNKGRPRRLPCRAARGGGGHGRGGGGRVEEARREGGGQGGRGPPSPPSLPPLGPLSRLRGAPSGRRLGLKARAPPADAAPARTPAQRSPPPPPQRYVAARSQSRDSAARTRGHAPRRACVICEGVMRQDMDFTDRTRSLGQDSGSSQAMGKEAKGKQRAFPASSCHRKPYAWKEPPP